MTQDVATSNKKITLSVYEFNDIMRVAKQYTEKRERRSITEFIFIKSKDNVVYVNCLTPYFACWLEFPTACHVDDCEFVLPVLPLLKKQAEFCEISEVDNNKIAVKTALQTILIERPQELETVHFDRWLPKEAPRETIVLNAKLLKKALSVYKGSLVVEFHGALEPLVFSDEDGGKKSIFLPMRQRKKREV